MTLHFPNLYGLLSKTQKLTVLKYGKVCFILPSIVFLSFRGVSSLANVAKHTPSQRCSLSGFTFLMNPKGRTMKELESPVGHGWLGNQGGSRVTAHHKSFIVEMLFYEFSHLTLSH